MDAESREDLVDLDEHVPEESEDVGDAKHINVVENEKEDDDIILIDDQFFIFNSFEKYRIPLLVFIEYSWFG